MGSAGSITIGHSVPIQMQSLVHISTNESFWVGVGFCQGWPLSPILLITFIDRIFHCSQEVKCVQEVFPGYLHCGCLSKNKQS